VKKLQKSISKFRELIMAFIFLAVYVVLYISTYHIRSIAASDGLGPRFTPRVVLICLIGLTIILMIKETVRLVSAKKHENRSSEDATVDASKTKEDKAPKEHPALDKGTISIISLILYVLLLKPLGFVLASVLYVITQMFFFSGKEKRKPVLFICLGIGLCLVIYLIFKKVMYIGLPSGILSFM